MKYVDEQSLPQLNDEEFAEFRKRARPYTVVILKSGPRFEPPDPGFQSEVGQIIYKHGRRNVQLHLAGLMPVVCPISDGSGISGTCVFDATPEEVEMIMSRDPGVLAGVFTYEIHQARSFPGSTL